jgi:hypothetical protein
MPVESALGTKPTSDLETTPTKIKTNKLKDKAVLKPKKFMMINPIQERKVAMSSPELIDVMATKDL